MPDSLDIATVARLTGLSSRALRFYEARGLVRPLRGASGRRYYGPAELERIHQIVTLKRAGLSLAEIDRLTRRGIPDLAALIAARLAALAQAAAQLERLRAVLLSVQSRVERSEPIDVATFCSLIEQGDETMTEQTRAWQNLADRYMNDEARADFARTMPTIRGDFDQADYAARWRDLGARVKAALPLDPAGAAALGLVREWFALLAPFTAVATPAMWEGAGNMYANMDAWQGTSTADPGFDAEVWAFIGEAAKAARAAGHAIGPMPAWMEQPGQG